MKGRFLVPFFLLKPGNELLFNINNSFFSKLRTCYLCLEEKATLLSFWKKKETSMSEEKLIKLSKKTKFEQLLFGSHSMWFRAKRLWFWFRLKKWFWQLQKNWYCGKRLFLEVSQNSFKQNERSFFGSFFFAETWKRIVVQHQQFFFFKTPNLLFFWQGPNQNSVFYLSLVIIILLPTFF